eukprot:COSAG04_NODE_24696_length_318_cov_0.707763_1_plen_106_part_11
MARQFFAERLRIDGGISAVQCAVFIGVGLQYRTVDEIAAELDVPVNQLLALFNKLIRKLRCAASRAFPTFFFFFDVLKSAGLGDCSTHLRSLKEAQVAADIPTAGK